MRAKHETVGSKPPALDNEARSDNIYMVHRDGSEVGATHFQKGHDTKS
jgi:hypothetical protein